MAYSARMVRTIEGACKGLHGRDDDFQPLLEQMRFLGDGPLQPVYVDRGGVEISGSSRYPGGAARQVPLWMPRAFPGGPAGIRLCGGVRSGRKLRGGSGRTTGGDAATCGG